ncbi:hypothetical protein K503DRAFT_858797 [Rhizopogon vinicolor AM-OR11-026]|uniref:Uncharacterized protein n=1 Tax=Rhizopogon vinicolor AM-OR11-026 TaxID=1314800 RepID=A0A1B7MR87_9AGAM|nr:hypothetical protein K503DRAFT_858797 [Rhizopogon vinicolor AM-OR11-026]
MCSWLHSFVITFTSKSAATAICGARYDSLQRGFWDFLFKTYLGLILSSPEWQSGVHREYPHYSSFSLTSPRPGHINVAYHITFHCQSPLTGIKSIRVGRAPPYIVDVPLAHRLCGRQSDQLTAQSITGAPIKDDGYVGDEDFDSHPPSPNLILQRASAPVQITTGEYGSDRL